MRYPWNQSSRKQPPMQPAMLPHPWLHHRRHPHQLHEQPMARTANKFSVSRLPLYLGKWGRGRDLSGVVIRKSRGVEVPLQLLSFALDRNTKDEIINQRRVQSCTETSPVDYYVLAIGRGVSIEFETTCAAPYSSPSLFNSRMTRKINSFNSW